MSKKTVLFICQHNSARSQMAEEYLRMLGGDAFQTESAGLEPSEINPLVVEAMKEEGVDLSGKKTQSVFELFKAGSLFEYVVTVCDPELDAKCPLFPGVTHRLNWPFPDPSALEGTPEEKLDGTREIRDTIKMQIIDFIDEHKHSSQLSIA